MLQPLVNTHISQWTAIDHVHCCISETSKLLKQAVIYTYNQKSPEDQKKFYLIGYKPRSQGFHHRKIYGDPSKEKEGGDIKWQLKNLRWHNQEYAEYMNIYEDVLDDISGFLLFDVIHDCYFGSSKLSVCFSDKQFLYDCIEACEELVNAIQDSSFYVDIQKEAYETSRKLEFLSLSASKLKDFNGDKFDILLKQFEMTVQKDENESHHSNEDSGIYSTDITVNSTHLRTFNTPSTKSPLPMDSSMVIVETPVVHNKKISIVKDSIKACNSPELNSDKVDEIDGSFVLI